MQASDKGRTRNCLVACVDGGLVNKLLAYLSLRVISDWLDLELSIYYTDHLGGLCGDLDVVFTDERVQSISQGEYAHILQRSKLIFSRFYFEQFVEDQGLLKDHGFSIGEFYLILTPRFIPREIFHEKMMAQWKSLKVHQEILDRVPKVDKKDVAVHCRLHHQGIRIPVEKYVSIIEQNLADPEVSRIFIACDDPDIKAHLLEVDTNRCYANELTAYWKDKGNQGVIDAMVDILTIDKTKRVYSPNGSSFCSLSAMYNPSVECILVTP